MKPLDFSDLKGKVAVMTGGTGVIGMALAEAMALAGIKLGIGGRDRSKSQTTAAAIAEKTGGTVLGLGFDVGSKPDLEAALAEIHDHFGPVDFLINGAGGNKPAATTPAETMASAAEADRKLSFFGLDTGAFEEVLKLNLMGTVLPSQVFAQDMVGRGGVILNISSMSAYRPLTKVAAYGTAKAAVNNLTEWMAVHLAPQKIRVNAVAPGFFLTEQNRFLMYDEKTGQKSARAQKIVAGTPLGRFGEVEELQGITLFLLSDLSRFITGAVVPVDGGFHAYSGV